MIILVGDSLGWQNRLIDKASVQFRLTTKRMYLIGMSFFHIQKQERRRHDGALPHTHNGYEHDEYGTFPGLSDKDSRRVEKILKSWDIKRKKLNL